MPSTTIAAGSNGQSLPQGTINVASAAAFPASGTISVATSATSLQYVTYTGKTGTSFTGCTGGTGTMSTGGAVVSQTISTVDTSNPVFASQQPISSDQGSEVVGTTDPFLTGHVSPASVYKMRAWDTVAETYVYWTSFGDTNTKPPTLNPVTDVTAVKTGPKSRTA